MSAILLLTSVASGSFGGISYFMGRETKITIKSRHNH
jgi:hypothetical protein